MMGSGQNRYLFTASQLEEFKHQALIYNYMVQGVPVPTDLLSSLKRKLDFSSALFLHQQGKHYYYYHNRFNKKEELEPERCKRTDGKKWRCKREAHGESKFCERHKHRGRNSSRKPVNLATNTTSPIINQPFIQTSALIHPDSLYSLSSSRHQNSSTEKLLLESGSSYQRNDDYRFMQSMRDGERAFFPMVSKTARSQHESYTTSKVASFDYLQTLNARGKFEDQSRLEGKDLNQHCFILGNDFKPARPMNAHRGEENQERFHQFFSEWPLKTKAHWLDNGDKHSDHASASTPLSTLKLFQPNPTLRWY